MIKNKTEMVDVVDEDNNIIGQVSKNEAHKKGLLHRTVIAEIINSKDCWLLVKQASDRQDAGRYVSPVGGHVRSGETTDEAIKREALEEVGMTEFNYKYIGKIIYNRKILGRQENHYFILYEIYTDQEPRLNQESQSCKWFTKDEIKKNLQKNSKIFGKAFFPIINNFYYQEFRSI